MLVKQRNHPINIMSYIKFSEIHGLQESQSCSDCELSAHGDLMGRVGKGNLEHV